MDSQVVLLEKVGVHGDIIKMNINSGVDMKTAIPQLAQVILNCFKSGNYKIILNMEQIKFPSASFIALLIEMTSRARRSDGDLKLININVPAKNNFATFTPLNYLSLDMDEEYALEDFEAFAPHKEPADSGTLPEAFTPQIGDTGTPESSLSGEIEPAISKKTTPDAEPIDVEKSGSIPLSPVHQQPAISFQSKGSSEQEKEAHADDIRPDAKVASPEKIPPPKIKPDDSEAIGINKSKDIKIHRDSKSKSYRIRVKSKNDSLYKICDFVTVLAKKAGMPEREIGKIKVTVYEACLNVIEHAYHSDPDEWIVVSVKIQKPEFIIIIQDWGECFEFDDSKPYDVKQAMQDRKTGGFGLYIIRRSMNDVQYKTDPINGNRLILKKIIKEPS